MAFGMISDVVGHIVFGTVIQEVRTSNIARVVSRHVSLAQSIHHLLSIIYRSVIKLKKLYILSTKNVNKLMIPAVGTVHVPFIIVRLS